MANGTGIAVIDFGTGSNEAVVLVTDQLEILDTSKVEAFVMADDTTIDHTASDHRYFNCLTGLTCGTATATEGFSIYATSTQKLQGTYQVRWVWAD